MQFEETEIIYRRLAEPSSDWLIALPILFGLVVLFLISCLRRDKGIGTLLLGLCMMTILPALMSYNPKTLGWPPPEGQNVDILLGWVIGSMLLVVDLLFFFFWQRSGENRALGAVMLVMGLIFAIPTILMFWPPAFLSWPSTIVATMTIWPIEVEIALRYVLAALIVGGFMVNLLLEFQLPAPIAWVGGGMGLLIHVGWAWFSRSMTEGWSEPLPLQVAPYMLLFMVQCVLSAVRANTWIGLLVILGLSILYLPFAFLLKPEPLFAWWVILVPMLSIALFYVAMMYVNDAKTIHPVWSAFLGLLRCAVYAILAMVFLLPGCQSFETTEIAPKVLIIIDVSESMQHKDELARPGEKDMRLTRQDKVLAFLLNAPPGFVDPEKKVRQAAWIERVLEKSPATVYRFGDKADDLTVHKLTRGSAQFPALDVTLDRFLNPNLNDIRLTEAEKQKTFTNAKAQEEELARRERVINQLLAGTDVAGSANQVARIEATNFVQAIIIISDGRSNNPGGSEQAARAFLAAANHPERKIPVFTIGVGSFQQPVEIKIEELQAPQNIRPEEKIPLRVPVIASKKLSGDKIEVTLEALRTKDQKMVPFYPTWWSRRTAPVYKFPVKEGILKGDGEFSQTVVEYEIDLLKLFVDMNPNLAAKYLGVAPGDVDFKVIKSREPDFMKFALLSGNDSDKYEKVPLDAIKPPFYEKFFEGEWEFNARVPKHAQEVLDEPDHVSRPPARVQVQSKKPRILLFAGGPTRDYQFLRTLLAREAQAKRIDLSVYLQSGARLDNVDQDVPPERLLTHFPHRRGPDDPRDRFSSINQYDVIVACDPDWSALGANLPDQPADPSMKTSNLAQAKLLKNWVDREAGGIIFIAGPVNTYELATSGKDYGDLPTMVPVELKDYRLFPDIKVDMKTKYPLQFTQQALATDFLKLEVGPKVDSPIAGWDKFFWGESGRPTSGEEPVRGFFSYYPVEAKRGGTTVLATFDGPKETNIKGGTEQQPYLATMQFGSGKTVYVGGETWRLRQYKESYHETFWLNLIRYAMGGSQNREKFGRWVATPRAPTGTIPVEIQIKEAVNVKGESDDKAEMLMPGDPLPPNGAFKPKIYLRKRGDTKDIAVFDLKPKPSDGRWDGWWEGKVKIKEEGEYELVNKIFAPKEANPLTAETLVHNLQIYQPKREDVNLREDFDALKDLATDADPIVARYPDIESYLPPRNKSSAEPRKLFFPLEKAEKIPECLVKLEPRRTRTLGMVQDLWDAGASIPLFHILWSVPLALLALAGAIMMFHQKYVMGTITLILAVLVPLLVLTIPWFGETSGWYTFDMWQEQPIDFAWVLLLVVSLLGLEWLTRKLLKLA
jgi:hypothetical protein